MPFDRDRGRPLGRCPSHTTRHAGPHRAVREVEVVDGYGQSPQAFLFYVPPNELHHELSRVGLHPSLFNPPQLPELLMPCTFERHNFRLSSSFSPSLHASSCGVGRGWLYSLPLSARTNGSYSFPVIRFPPTDCAATIFF